MLDKISRAVEWLRGEPELTRSAATLIIGVAAAVGLHITQHQIATDATGAMAIIAVVQAWRTRAANRRTADPGSSMGDWRNDPHNVPEMPVEETNDDPKVTP